MTKSGPALALLLALSVAGCANDDTSTEEAPSTADSSVAPSGTTEAAEPDAEASEVEPAVVASAAADPTGAACQPDDQTGCVNGLIGGVLEPIAGVGVTLYDVDSSPVAQTSSDAQGAYSFAVFRAGTYYVGYEEADLPAGASLGEPPSTSAGPEGTASVEVELGSLMLTSIEIIR